MFCSPWLASACKALARKRSITTRLIRRYGDLRVHAEFEIGAPAATYDIDADGRPIHIRVLRARHPASAWLIIDSIARAKIARSRLRLIAPEDFPVPHCTWVDTPPVEPAWL